MRQDINDEIQDIINRLAANDPDLTSVRIDDEDTKEGLIEIAKALENNSILEDLCIDSTNIDDDVAKAFAKALETNSTLTELTLSRMSGVMADDPNPILINDDGAIALAKSLEKNSTLKKLEIDTDKTTNKSAFAFAKALAKNSTLTHLYYLNASWDAEGFGSKGAESLAQSLEINSTLIYLSLDGHSIGNKGAVAIAKALEKNSSIEYLDISGCNIGNKGSTAIAKALEKNSSLTHLNLNRNPSIGNAGLAEFAKTFKTNTTLTIVENDPETEEDLTNAFDLIDSALQNNWALTWLFRDGNAKRNDDFAKKLAALCTNLLAQQKQAGLNDPNSKATIFRKKLSELSSKMHSLAYQLPITFWDFQKLNHGGYAALKLKLTEIPNELTRQKANFIVERLKVLEPHIYVRDVVLAGAPERLKKSMLQQIFEHHKSLSTRIDALAAGAPDSGFRIITDEALRDWSLEGRIASGIKFSETLVTNNVESLELTRKIGETLTTENKERLLNNDIAFGRFLGVVDSLPSSDVDYNHIASTALQKAEKRKEVAIEGADEVAANTLKKSRIHEPAQSADQSRG